MATPRSNRILESMNQGKIPVGMEVNSGSPSIIEVLGYCGFDFIMLDMEHSRMNPESMENCIRSGEATSLSVLVRIPENNHYLIRWAKEAGAHGIVIPHISTPEDVRHAVQSLRFPPEGRCGMGPSRAAQYGMFQEYDQWSSDNVMLIPLLEDKTAIENAETILAELKPRVDAIGVGKGDLGRSLITKLGESPDTTYISQAFEKVLDLSRKTRIPVMDMVMSTDELKINIESGVKIILCSIDWLVFAKAAQQYIKAMTELTVA